MFSVTVILGKGERWSNSSALELCHSSVWPNVMRGKRLYPDHIIFEGESGAPPTVPKT